MLQPERDMMLIIRLGAYLFIYLFSLFVNARTTERQEPGPRRINLPDALNKRAIHV
jgi:hypothetical protein